MSGIEADDTRTMRERMLAGDLYQGADQELVQEMQRAMTLTKRFNESDPVDQAARDDILRELLGTFADGAHVRPPLQVDYGSHLHLGERCFVNFGLMAIDVAEIRIGADTIMGPNVQLLTPTHPIDPELRRAQWEAAAPITIGENVWLGGGVIVCPGVTIGGDSVIGAGTVVTKDVPAGVVAAGNPARIIRSVT